MWFFNFYCISCGKKLERKSLVCKECISSIIPLSKSGVERCKSCSKPLKIFEKNFCGNCKDKNFHFEKNTSLFDYNNKIIKKLIALFKFQGNTMAAEELVEIIREEFFKFINCKKWDIITCVPTSNEFLNRREFNPVEFLLKKLNLNYKNLLARKAHLKKQSELEKSERETYIKGQFYFADRSIDVKGKKILLIDDIFTTGNTVNEISGLFKSHFAYSVEVLTFFRD
jgi:competence protein ComFC